MANEQKDKFKPEVVEKVKLAIWEWAERKATREAQDKDNEKVS